jgi:class 3 adenylate cyclase
MSASNPERQIDTFYPVGDDGERRQITAVFYDMVNSTALLMNSNPEVFRRAQRHIHDEAVNVFKRSYLGSITGDGGFFFFGIPLPLEDAAECAVSAALEFVERCKNRPAANDDLKLPQIRVGVATGVVILADDPNREWSLKKEVVGLAPNLASRLQNEAAPNSVVVSESTYQLTRTAFDFELLGPRTLKGWDGQQIIWMALGPRSADSRFLQHRRSDGPIISRERELGFLRDCLHQALCGHGKAVLISGEAGIGKSRLIEELRQPATESQSEVRLLQCHPRATNNPLHPLIHYLRGSLQGPCNEMRPASIMILLTE